MEFGIAFKGDLSMDRTIALCRQAEVGGFDYVWFFDSHILWSDPYTRMAVCMEHTERLKFGPLVTNPKVRDWSVNASMWATLLEIGALVLLRHAHHCTSCGSLLAPSAIANSFMRFVMYNTPLAATGVV